MSKIYGVTVGTPINPAHIEDKIKPVKTVNGKAPDENGNVEIEGGNGATGANGLTPYIKDGYWWIGEENTNVKAEGVDGKDGKDGAQGIQGIQGIPGIPGEKGDKGDTGATGAKGDKGDPYTLTSTDKAAIVQDVLAALPYYDGTVTISGGVELISFTIAGTSYEAEDGMTWAEWVESEYNTGGFETATFSGVLTVLVRGTITSGYGLAYNSAFVPITDMIVADRAYEEKYGSFGSEND